jgi:hypothetical protein
MTGVGTPGRSKIGPPYPRLRVEDVEGDPDDEDTLLFMVEDEDPRRPRLADADLDAAWLQSTGEARSCIHLAEAFGLPEATVLRDEWIRLHAQPRECKASRRSATAASVRLVDRL